MRFNDAKINLSAIDQTDDSFRISTNKEVSGLKTSILGVGLLAPPLLLPVVLETGKNLYRIISGFRRVSACRELGWEKIPARLAPLKALEKDCAMAAAADNAFARPLNPIETSRALTLLSRHCADQAELARSAGEAGLPDAPDLIQKLLPLAALPFFLQSSILSGDLSMSMAQTLAAMNQDLAIRLADLFFQLKLSLNKQREILGLLEEIALRENKTVMDILLEAHVRSILENPDADRNQRTEAFRRFLKRRRHPAITRAETAFTETLRQLPLPSGVRLNHPRHFESPEYVLSISFKSLSELSHRYRKTGEILSHPAFENLLN